MRYYQISYKMKTAESVTLNRSFKSILNSIGPITEPRSKPKSIIFIIEHFSVAIINNLFDFSIFVFLKNPNNFDRIHEWCSNFSMEMKFSKIYWNIYRSTSFDSALYLLVSPTVRILRFFSLVDSAWSSIVLLL